MKSKNSLFYILIVVSSLFLMSVQKFHKTSIKKVLENSLQKIDTLLNTKKYLVLGKMNKGLTVKIVHKSEVKKYPNLFVHYKNKDDVLLVKGDFGNYLVFYEKFIPKSYNNYKAEIFTGKLKDPILGNDWYFKEYKESILEQCKAGINFGSHYTIVSFGCGTACQQNLIIDRRTGKIVSEFVTSMGSDFQKGSSLILTNVGMLDKKTNLMELAEGMNGAEYMYWNGKELKKIH